MKYHAIHNALTALISIVWVSFVLGVVAALLGRPLRLVEIGRGDYWNIWAIIHLAGILIVPVLVAFASFRAKRCLWLQIATCAAYLLVTCLTYPAAVRWTIHHYPQQKDPGWGWVRTNGPDGDYLYVDTTRALDDAQYAGRIILFPLMFDLPDPVRAH